MKKLTKKERAEAVLILDIVASQPAYSLREVAEQLDASCTAFDFARNMFRQVALVLQRRSLKAFDSINHAAEAGQLLREGFEPDDLLILKCSSSMI